MNPFAVAANGQSVNTATGPQSLLSSAAPLSKLDVTNINSFQTVNILFNHEPPQPALPVGNFVDTQLLQFAHGYTYIPAVEMTWQNPSPSYPATPGAGSSATTFFEIGDETGSANIPGVNNSIISGTATRTPFASVFYNGGGISVQQTDAYFYIKVDATNVTLYIRKVIVAASYTATYYPLYVIGESVNMRFYVFAEPGTTSTY